MDRHREEWVRENHDTLIALASDMRYVRQAVDELKKLHERTHNQIISLISDVEGLKAKVMVLCGVVIAIIGGMIKLAL